MKAIIGSALATLFVVALIQAQLSAEEMQSTDMHLYSPTAIEWKAAPALPPGARMAVLPAGSFGYYPAGMKHTAWSEGETVIQLHGIGPWQINYVNPADDPRNAKR
jgi:hypothetical protein